MTVSRPAFAMMVMRHAPVDQRSRGMGAHGAQ
jgi:hypothetical protein